MRKCLKHRKYLAVIALALSLAIAVPVTLSTTGCAKRAVQAPIPNQLSTFDGWAYRSLFDAQAALNSLRDDVASGKLKVSDSTKATLNQVFVDYNAAQAVYKTWHDAGGTGPVQPVTDAITKVNNGISTIATQAIGGVH